MRKREWNTVNTGDHGENTKANAVSGPTRGWLTSLRTSGRFLASCSTARLNSSMVGFIRSSSSAKFVNSD